MKRMDNDTKATIAFVFSMILLVAVITCGVLAIIGVIPGIWQGITFTLTVAVSVLTIIYLLYLHDKLDD